MRNRFPGMCFRCDKAVAAGEGFFQRMKGAWVVRCGWCVGKGNQRDTDRSRMAETRSGSGPKDREPGPQSGIAMTIQEELS